MTILAGSICGGVWGVLSPAGSMGPQPLISAYSPAVHLMCPLISITNHNYNDNHQHDHDHNHHNHHHDHHHNHDDHPGRAQPFILGVHSAASADITNPTSNYGFALEYNQVSLYLYISYRLYLCLFYNHNISCKM